MTELELKQQQLIQLKEILITWFSQEELEDMSFDLGIDYLAIGSQTKESNVRNLLMMLSRRGRLDRLIELCDEKRPEIEWGIFTHLTYVEPVPQISPAVETIEAPPVRQGGYRFLLSMVGVLLVVILTGSLAAAYYLTRTSQPVSAEPGLVIQVPARETVSREPQIIVRSSPSPVPTNVVMTAVPAANVDGRNDSDTPRETIEDQPVSAVTEVPTVEPPPQLDDPVSGKVTDTYQNVPLKEANVRNGPGINFSVLAQLKANAPVQVYAYAKNSYGTPWYKISLGESQFGWISSVLINLDSATLDDLPFDSSFVVEATATPIPEEAAN